jgi:hypothetical protein
LATLATASKAQGQQVASPATVEEAIPPLPADLVEKGNQPDYYDLNLDVTQLGTATPTPAELKTARDVLANAPYNTQPIEVAKYFRDVGQGLHSREWSAYARGWPVRYNPVIISFFKATRLNPLNPEQNGDGTPWCAAFVNWCIARAVSTTGSMPADIMSHRFDDAQLSRGSWSASSGSFRCWQSDASIAPKRGSVVVWALEGTVDQCKPGAGHVGFLDSNIADGTFIVIGGNQFDPNLNQHAITRARFSQTFNRKLGAKAVPVQLHSIRTAGWL